MKKSNCVANIMWIEESMKVSKEAWDNIRSLKIKELPMMIKGRKKNGI